MAAENDDSLEIFIDLEDEQPVVPKKGVSGTHLTLLLDAQEYLRKLLDEKAPDSLLAASWESFYAVYDDLIRRFVVAQGVPKSDVDDCVQEVWTEIASRLDTFDRPPHRPGLRAWLYTLVRSKAADVFRRRSRRLTDSLDGDSLSGTEPADTRADPATLYELNWEQAIIDSQLAQLSDELSATNSRILQMRLAEHLSVDEVASELDLKPEQVHARQHRIMKKLRARVALYTGEPFGSEGA
jgi:RNA polymerase sigma factor (sigma-70 family)